MISELSPTGLNQAQNQVFHDFLEFGSLIFLEIACSDSLQQCLTFSRDKTHEKKLESQIWTQTGHKIRFLAIFSSLVH